VNTASPVFFLDVSTDWYRKRSVRVAFVLSLLVHAAAIALLPGLRVPSPEQPAPLLVELVPAPPPENPAPVAQPEPQRQPTPVVRRQVTAPQTQVKQPEPVPAPIQTRPEPVAVAPTPLQREPVPEPIPPVPEVRSEIPPPPAPPARLAPAPQPPPPEPQAAAKAEPTAPPPLRQVQLPLDPAALKAFGEVLAQAIGKRKDYPRLARVRNWQGTTELKLQIGPDGKLQDVHVGHSSGFPLLDAAAVQMVHNAAPLPDVPETLRGRELTMTVPVVFKLEAL
jgi:periplasmic protein TonB